MAISRDPPTIPLFDQTPNHSSVPTKVHTAVARSGCPGRPSGRRVSAAPWTAVSTTAGWPRVRLAVAIVAILLSAATSARAQPANSTSVRGGAGASDPWSILVGEASQRFGVPDIWIRAVMQVESARDARAVSPKGAMGLMQIMPATYGELRVRYGLGTDPYDPGDNILAGAAYLREMHDRFGTPGFLAAYNAGPVRYEDHLATGRPLPEETRNYIARLAPIVCGEQPLGTMAVSPRTVSWTEGPLFVDRPVSAVSDRVMPAGVQSGHGSASRTAAASVALAPRAAGLFVRSAGEALP
jgi:soluble lytic murein transglycosylase-like protein